MTADFFDSIRRGDQEAVDDAIAGDADLLKARDRAGLSPVMAAAYGGHPRLSERLATRVAATQDGWPLRGGHRRRRDSRPPQAGRWRRGR